VSRQFKAFLWLLAIVLAIPILLVGGVVMLMIAHDFYYSGSARGQAALERIHDFALHDLGNGRWRQVAIDARAQWGAPDWSGDRIEHNAFTLPHDEIEAFHEALKAEWLHQPDTSRTANDPHVFYVFEGASLDLNRSTGHVEIEWGNFLNLTPTTKPATRAAPTTLPSP
jgi:hypothetical protein